MPAYHRTQILLEPEQHQYLTARAAANNQSLSAFVRELIAQHYNAEAEAKERLRQQRLEALERLTKFREEMAARTTEPIPDPVDLLNEMREERMEDFERIWRGEE